MLWLFSALLVSVSLFSSQVKVGIDVLFDEGLDSMFKGKRIALITNQTAINKYGETAFDCFMKLKDCQVVAVFAPEHGFYGDAYAYEFVKDRFHGSIPVYSLHGNNRRPTQEQLQSVDILVFDMQDIGSRSYTYNGTLFYCMEEAAKSNIDFVVLDRPNPQGGLVVDGPLMDDRYRSFLGYINIPYCHGMTLGELSRLFNCEYQVGCRLKVIPMQGWKRGMVFDQTGLRWVPTSPQIPEADTAFYYPTTGILGVYTNISIGVGYTLPFKIVGAPWIDGFAFAQACNDQQLPGVHFRPFYFRPFFGRYKNEACQGVLISVTDPNSYLPVTTGYTLAGVLKNLYPKHFEDGLKKVLSSKGKIDACHKLNGREEVLSILEKEPFVIWKLREICKKDREKFLHIRSKYLLPEYAG